MLNTLKAAFKRTNDSIILATPLVILLSVIGLYSAYARVSVDTMPKAIVAIITLIVICAGCAACWFYAVKKTIKLSTKFFVFDTDRAKEFLNILKNLPKGIGELFLPFLFLITFDVIIFTLVAIFISWVVSTHIGTINPDLIAPNHYLISSEELLNMYSNLPERELFIVNAWYLLFSAFTIIFMFITFLWIPEIVYNEKNPLIALKNSFDKLFSKFSKTLGIYICTCILYLLTGIISAILMFYPLLYFFVLLLYYYYLLYAIILAFTYYEQEFIVPDEDE